MKRFTALLTLLLAAIFACAQAPQASPYKNAMEQLRSVVVMPLPEWHAHAGNLAHGEDLTANDEGWAAAKTGEKWTDGSHWLRRTIEVPATLNGYSLVGARIELDARVSSGEAIQIASFSNGSLIGRTDEDTQLPILLTTRAKAGEKFVVAMRVTGSPVETRFDRAQLIIHPAEGRPDPGLLRDEILSVLPLVEAYPTGLATRRALLDAAVAAIDFKALAGGDQKGFDDSLRAAQVKLEALRPYLSQFSIRATGNSHIDMAWLWPWTETVEVTRNTFSSALQMMREYPDLTFTMATAQSYEWMEEKYPHLFREIQQRVKEGRWEIVGGMWVEPDLNLPAGESLTRQLLYGKRYFQQKFGVDVKIGWNPDSFGYNWQLPQIYKRAGIDYFVTQKIYWNETTKFPYKLFWWQAPDGSRLLTYFPHDYANPLEAQRMTTDLAEYAPSMYKADAGAGAVPEGKLEMMHLFGVGDHGGGPTRLDLDTALELRKKGVLYPRLKFGTAGDYFHELEGKLSGLNVPTWNDELYLEFHRGVQTTQSENKRRNREAEVLLTQAEKFAAFDSLYGPVYPHAEFDRAWKHVLFNQFHDILPGSGIAINYVDAERRYDEVRLIGQAIEHHALADLAARVEAPAAGVVLFNSLNWPRTEAVEFDVQMPDKFNALRATDPQGRELPVEVLSIDRSTSRVRLRMIATQVPAMGYEYIRLEAAQPKGLQTALRASGTTLENEFFRVEVEPSSGCMTSLYDKHSRQETLAAADAEPGAPALAANGKPCGNLLQIFEDKPKQWDAWNVDADFIEHHTDLLTADEVKLVEVSPLRAVLRVHKHHLGSTFVQDITMYPGVERIDVRTTVDWHAEHQLLKVAFPLRAHSEHAAFEIPYGAIERPTTRRTPEEKAKFEVPALQWADLGDANGGFSLLNASKYGYDALGNVLRLSLLRAPKWPDPMADQGHHEFTYALYPHGGSWQQAMTVRRGFELNQPLLSVAVAAHHGPLPQQASLVSSTAENIVITAVKQAEDGNSLVVRYYEWAGKAGDVTLQLGQAAALAMEANLLEKPETQLALSSDGRSITVPTRAFEIKTVLVKLRP